MNNTNSARSSKTYSELAKANEEMYNEFYSVLVSKMASNNISLHNSSNNNNHEDNRPIYKECVASLEACDKFKQQLEDECQKRAESILKFKKATEEIKQAGIKEEEEIKNQIKALKHKYTRDKNKAKALEAECLVLEEKRSAAVARTSLYEPLVKRFCVKVDKMACKEGKPIDPTGAGGTCNVWECHGSMENS